MAIFDLDGTLTWRDTFVFYVLGYLRRHPLRSLRLWRLPYALLAFAIGGRNRGQLKSRIIQMIMGGEPRSAIDSWTAAFVQSLQPRGRFRPAALAALEAHRLAGDSLVLLSASPDLYVPDIGRLLGFERILCTEIAWRGGRLEGSLKSPNRQGAEKLRCLEWLRNQYPGMRVVAYGNSAFDLVHMVRADRALLVNGNARARALASKSAIPTSEWT
ncbi:MAG: HAD-IB family phosphatase [Pseudomonadota bacterium]|nr:HAD-IB family phosphatase [Pseudomonadota bacterium]